MVRPDVKQDYALYGAVPATVSLKRINDITQLASWASGPDAYASESNAYQLLQQAIALLVNKLIGLHVDDLLRLWAELRNSDANASESNALQPTNVWGIFLKLLYERKKRDEAVRTIECIKLTFKLFPNKVAVPVSDWKLCIQNSQYYVIFIPKITVSLFIINSLVPQICFPVSELILI